MIAVEWLMLHSNLIAVTEFNIMYSVATYFLDTDSLLIFDDINGPLIIINCSRMIDASLQFNCSDRKTASNYKIESFTLRWRINMIYKLNQFSQQGHHDNTISILLSLQSVMVSHFTIWDNPFVCISSNLADMCIVSPSVLTQWRSGLSPLSQLLLL